MEANQRHENQATFITNSEEASIHLNILDKNNDNEIISAEDILKIDKDLENLDFKRIKKAYNKENDQDEKGLFNSSFKKIIFEEQVEDQDKINMENLILPSTPTIKQSFKVEETDNREK